MEIVDCFLFFNEIDMLMFRLKELNDFVDFFILVESNHTFSGNPKELFYENNKHLFSAYNHKIISIAIKGKEDVSAWDRETMQRNAVTQGLKLLDLNKDDIIILSDCDEIPNPKLLKKVKNEDITWIRNIYSLEQDFYYYNLNSLKLNYWVISKIFRYGEISISKRTPQEIRHTQTIKITDGGWHFSYFGSPEKIRTKIESFSHTEFNDEQYKNLITIEQNIELKKDLFFRSNEDLIHCEIDEKKLPKNYKMLLNTK
jgi:beta-1,4-mannosyl-glycoprotein beta-1,4-N-acetylglucosaminyltransferase